MDFLLINGKPVVMTRELPVPQGYPACDVATRVEITVLTGEMIHVFATDDKIFVSEAFINKSRS